MSIRDQKIFKITSDGDTSDAKVETATKAASTTSPTPSGEILTDGSATVNNSTDQWRHIRARDVMPSLLWYVRHHWSGIVAANTSDAQSAPAT